MLGMPVLRQGLSTAGNRTPVLPGLGTDGGKPEAGDINDELLFTEAGKVMPVITA